MHTITNAERAWPRHGPDYGNNMSISPGEAWISSCRKHMFLLLQ